MKSQNSKRTVTFCAAPSVHDRFFLLPAAVEALRESEVSCPFCAVKLLSQAGLIGGLCPACFEERCATCGAGILLDDGELAPGLKVGQGGSWKCAACSRTRRRSATPRSRQPAAATSP